MLQGLKRLLMLTLVTMHGDVNTGIAQVIGDPNFGHSHHSQTRIFEFESNNLRDLFTQCLSDAFCPMHNSDIRSQTSDISRKLRNLMSDIRLLTPAFYSSVAATLSIM